MASFSFHFSITCQKLTRHRATSHTVLSATLLTQISIVPGAIGSVHLLPIYPSSGDGGFAPIKYTAVDPEMGTWDDVKEIADRFDLCVEFMVNHISPKSDQFQDFIQKGDDSEFADMFIDWDKFWPEGEG
jgi:hypothetical protein